MTWFYPGLEELLQQTNRQGALPVGVRAAAHAVAQEDIQLAVGPLEIGSGVAAHRLAALFLGGHSGQSHQRLLLEKGDGVLSGLVHPEGDTQQVRQVGQTAGPCQGSAARTLCLHPEQAPAVPVYRGPDVQSQLRHPLAQLPVSQQVGNELPAQFCRGSPQQISQLGILPAHCRPALLDPSVVLAAVEQGGEFLVYGG